MTNNTLYQGNTLEYSIIVMNRSLHPSQAHHACDLLVNTSNFSYVYTVTAF